MWKCIVVQAVVLCIFLKKLFAMRAKKIGEKLIQVAKERGRINDESEYLRKLREQKQIDIEEAIKRGDIKKKDDAPLKIFT